MTPLIQVVTVSHSSLQPADVPLPFSPFFVMADCLLCRQIIACLHEPGPLPVKFVSLQCSCASLWAMISCRTCRRWRSGKELLSCSCTCTKWSYPRWATLPQATRSAHWLADCVHLEAMPGDSLCHALIPKLVLSMFHSILPVRQRSHVDSVTTTDHVDACPRMAGKTS